MKYLSGEEEKEAISYLQQAAQMAKESTCDRSHCGSLVVYDKQIIGEGFNSPPGEFEHQKRCACLKDSYDKKVTDKTCCVHAEQRAIMNALKNYANLLVGSRLYFIRLDQNSEMSYAGKPYCTICSKMALDAGISEFVLWHEDGIAVYDTDEYNTLSYAYEEK